MGYGKIRTEMDVLFAVQALYHVARLNYLFGMQALGTLFKDGAELDRSREPSLGPANPDGKLNSLEGKLKVKLPPSYRAFLKHHDGFKNCSGSSTEMQLLSIDELRASRVKAGSLLAIGQDSVVSMNFERPTGAGEFEIRAPLDRTYPSFLSFLRSTARAEAESFASQHQTPQRETRFPDARDGAIETEQDVLVAIQALYHAVRLHHLFSMYELGDLFTQDGPVAFDRSREPSLGPANTNTDAMLDSLERRLQVKLSPSYRAFLKHYDGFKGDIYFSRLLSLDELRSPRAKGGPLVIGKDSEVAMNVNPAPDSGEAEVYAAEAHPSFLSYLRESFSSKAMDLHRRFKEQLPDRVAG
jgi:cell wall assembly regulator SMI1